MIYLFLTNHYTSDTALSAGVNVAGVLSTFDTAVAETGLSNVSDGRMLTAKLASVYTIVITSHCIAHSHCGSVPLAVDRAAC